jgi:hypothetical protein
MNNEQSKSLPLLYNKRSLFSYSPYEQSNKFFPKPGLTSYKLSWTAAYQLSYPPRRPGPFFTFHLLQSGVSPNMVSGGLRSMLAIDCSWKKDRYTTSAVSAVHEPLSSPVTEVMLDSWDRYDWQGSSDALTNWMNERWRKTGFQISKEVVCFTLRYH